MPENKFELWGYIKSNVRKTPTSRTMNLDYVNFLACILLASDWFKDSQPLSQFTHAHYRDTVPLTNRCQYRKAGLTCTDLCSCSDSGELCEICMTTMVMMMMVMTVTMNMKRQIFMTRFHVGHTETFLYEHFTQLTTSQ